MALESEAMRGLGSFPIGGNIFHWILLFSRSKASDVNINIIDILVHFEKNSIGRGIRSCLTPHRKFREMRKDLNYVLIFLVYSRMALFLHFYTCIDALRGGAPGVLLPSKVICFQFLCSGGKFGKNMGLMPLPSQNLDPPLMCALEKLWISGFQGHSQAIWK